MVDLAEVVALHHPLDLPTLVVDLHQDLEEDQAEQAHRRLEEEAV